MTARLIILNTCWLALVVWAAAPARCRFRSVSKFGLPKVG